MKLLITGMAGFIGYHLARAVAESGEEVEIVGIDNINDYYSVDLKFSRLENLGLPRREISWERWSASRNYPNLRFRRMELGDRDAMAALFAAEGFDLVCHLAAQAGVRYSLENPHIYAESNITGFLHILEGCRHHPPQHLVFASSSSVYGMNTKVPFSVDDNVDHPVSLYAATKKANELLAHSYSHLFGLPVTGLRFFSVYGPWGRPDMALFLFVRSIVAGREIEVYHHGRCQRDFTYVDDIVAGVRRVLHRPPEPDPAWEGLRPRPSTSRSRYRIYNIGHNSPVTLLYFIQTIEKALGKKARMKMMDMQPGDVEHSWADVEDLRRDFDYAPQTTVEEGVRAFVDWYVQYYGVRPE